MLRNAINYLGNKRRLAQGVLKISENEIHCVPANIEALQEIILYLYDDLGTVSKQ